MPRKPFNPLDALPSPADIRARLSETEKLAHQLRILLKLAEDLRLPLVSASDLAAPEPRESEGAGLE
jgi:hypothetical protein